MMNHLSNGGYPFKKEFALCESKFFPLRVAIPRERGGNVYTSEWSPMEAYADTLRASK